MRRFDTVFPACGSANSAIDLSLAELHEYSRGAEWIDVCRTTEENPAVLPASSGL
jgi:prolyl-tRNA editing enzyme YbaK/EbsC (Cys-tRNA(Pro) deacylase)